MIALLDYGAGNLRSVEKALRFVGGDVELVQSPDGMKDASAVVLPGVGAFDDCVNAMQRQELLSAAREFVTTGRPFLGICVGMQLMAEFGHENGFHRGLGWVQGEVIGLRDGALKVPHMGWNEIVIRGAHPVLTGLEDGTDFYFVHSYHLRCGDEGENLAHAEYGEPICAVVGRDNMIGTQFHPEKSQSAGLKFISNFLSWHP